MSTRPRLRAKAACRVCNARRVRCDAMESQPCTNCKASGAVCELIKSRRGRYERGAARSRALTQASTANRNDITTLPSSFSGSTDIQHATLDAPSWERPSTTFSTERANIAHDDLYSSGSSNEFPATTPETVHSGSVDREGESTVFLGESNSISAVRDTGTAFNDEGRSPGERSKLQYPLTLVLSGKGLANAYESRPQAAKVKQLIEDSAFTFPSDEICKVLFSAYFAWFHPCYPIIDRVAFSRAYRSKTISPLLLQAVLFVGTSHCSEKTLRDVGVPHRHSARSDFYNRAKSLYDADYNTDKVTVCQALFLMSFWRAGPLLEKDTRHWLGAAISLAQTKGMHRSTTNNNSVDETLRKKIWWSLYVRDRQCSAALGLPIRIRDEDCDIDLLDVSDFDNEDTDGLEPFWGTQKLEHVLYAVQITRLARLLGKIVLREFSPKNGLNSAIDRATLKEELMKWEDDLSPEMRSNRTADSFWVSMLHISYSNLYILLYRSAYLGSKEKGDQDGGSFALQAASRITRITEDMLSQDLIQHGNVHLITSIFNALCIHTIHIRRSENTARKLAENRAQLCLLGLKELQRTWDITNWVLQLFFQFLEKSIAKKLQSVDTEDVPCEPAAAHGPSSPQNGHPYGPEKTTDPSQRPALEGTPHVNDRGWINRSADQVNSSAAGLDFTVDIFGTQEAEDFSNFQLQPDLYNGNNWVNGDLDEYYNSMAPHQDSMGV